MSAVIDTILGFRDGFANPCDRCGKQYGPKQFWLNGELHETGDEFCDCPIDWEAG